MTEAVLIDTGPLVAAIDRGDADHLACNRTLHRMYGPLITVWPVLTEAIFLLRGVKGGADQLLSLLEVARVELVPQTLDRAWMRGFFSKYSDQRPDLADACLVHAAESLNIRHVLTLDRRDFAIYRAKGKALEIVPIVSGTKP